jgi:hypothetical protein
MITIVGVVAITASHHSIATVVSPFPIVPITRTSTRSIPIIIVIPMATMVHPDVIVAVSITHPLLVGPIRSHRKSLRKLTLLLV